MTDSPAMAHLRNTTNVAYRERQQTCESLAWGVIKVLEELSITFNDRDRLAETIADALELQI